MKTLLIRQARILDPSKAMDMVGDILVEDGKIAAVAPKLDKKADEVIEAAGLVAAPGLIDMHVHLRDPGFTYKEDILSGCRAAAAGGFTAVAAMPNTKPSVDSPEVIRYILDKAEGADARVYPIADITRGQSGGELCDFAALKEAGAVGISDDGHPVKNAKLMLEGIRAGKGYGLLPISHCEDMDIIGKGIIHKGWVSDKLGVPGMDRASEDSITAREIALADSIGCPIHIAHVSTKGSVALIRDAKARGVQVTCETAPHYTLLTHEALLNRDANWRMNPPLREEEDRLAVIEGLRDGTIDAIITDHAPHAAEEKANFETAPNGIIGLETCFAASYTSLVKTGVLSLMQLIRLMSTNPAELLGVPGGTLAIGEWADITLIDPQEEWTFTEADIRSKSRNTPFLGTTFTGKVKFTLLGGRITHRG